MKRFIPKTLRGILLLLAGILIPVYALATAGDHLFTYKSDTDSLATQTLVGPTLGKALLLYDSTKPNGERLMFAQIDSSLTETEGVLRSYIPSWTTLDSRPGWTNTFDGSWGTLQGVPSSFFPTPHNHIWSDITNAQSSARASFSLTTTGSGAATYNSTTGVFNVPTYSPASLSINDAPGRTLVTATNATGFQVSSTRNADVCYEGSISTTSTIGGPATATVFLETADTNSTTPADWAVKARQVYNNTITLAVVLNQTQGNNWTICRKIPAGKYVRLRVGAVSGTASATINAEQQETLL